MLPARAKHSLLRKGRALLSRHRKSPLVRKLAQYNLTLNRWCEDSGYDFYTNGEHFVLRALSGQGFETVFDVGANTGEWTLMAREVFPGATIHAFEVAGPTFEQLKLNAGGRPGVVLNDFGLSDREGEITLKFFPGADDLATATDYPHEHPHTLIPGRVVTGDAYVRERGVGHIDFLKIDVEGMENLVLEGMEETIGRGGVSVIQFEYGTVNILTKFLLRDFYEFFGARGYEVGKVYPNYVEFRDYRFEHEDFLGPNYLAVSARRPELKRLLA